MPNKTSIEWTATYLPDGTVKQGYSSNPFYVTVKETGKRGWHCDKPSAGCGHCYSETLNGRFGTGLKYKAPNAELLVFHLNEKELFEILKLQDRLAKKGETAKLFPCDMTDLFLEQHTDEMIDTFFAVMAMCPNIVFQGLTKRIERASAYLNFNERHQNIHEAAKRLLGYDNPKRRAVNREDLPLPNVHLGTSVENQKAADERIPHLLATPAAVRFLSVEPLLENVLFDAFTLYHDELGHRLIDWVIVGGESGPGARPCDIQWIRSVIFQCQSVQVPVFVKQLGAKVISPNDTGLEGDSPDSWPEGTDYEDNPYGYREEYQGAPVRIRLASKKGNDMSEWPEDLRIRETV